MTSENSAARRESQPIFIEISLKIQWILKRWNLVKFKLKLSWNFNYYSSFNLKKLEKEIKAEVEKLAAKLEDVREKASKESREAYREGLQDGKKL